MKIKADWKTWLHNFRTRELETIFAHCSTAYFKNGLELCAGNGTQSQLLAKYIKNLRSTDFHCTHTATDSNQSIIHEFCDAGQVAAQYPPHSFDIVFSANLLEHVKNPDKVLSGIVAILRDDGITIHIVPTPFWKLCQIIIYAPLLFALSIERIVHQKRIVDVVREIRAIVREVVEGLTTGQNSNTRLADAETRRSGNNPATGIRQRSYISRLLLPEIHGVSPSHVHEFFAFSAKRWQKTFLKAGFNSVIIKKGPVASGYGLGWYRIATKTELGNAALTMF